MINDLNMILQSLAGRVEVQPSQPVTVKIMTYPNQMISILGAAVSTRILRHCDFSYNVALETPIEGNPYHRLNKNIVELQYESVYAFENSTGR